MTNPSWAPVQTPTPSRSTLDPYHLGSNSPSIHAVTPQTNSSQASVGFSSTDPLPSTMHIDGRIWLITYENEFDQDNAGRTLSAIYKSHYHEAYKCFEKTPLEVKEHWWSLFKAKYI